MVITTEGVFIIGPEWRNALGVLGAIRSPGLLGSGLSGFLFETQWLYWVIALGIGAACWEMGRRRGDSRLRNGGFGVGAAVIMWVLMAYMVVTPKERLYAAHQGLAQAAKEGNVDKIVGYLREPFRSAFLGDEGTGKVREEIEQKLKAYGVKETLITAYASDIAGKGAFTHVTLLTQTEMVGPVRTTWTLNWEDVAGEDWKISEADLEKVGDESIGH